VIEFAIFALIFAAAVIIGAAVLWVLGIPFGLRFSSSAFIVLIGLAFVVPAVVNILTALYGEGLRERVTSAFCAVGLLVCSFAFLLPVIAPTAEAGHGFAIFVVGFGILMGSAVVSALVEMIGDLLGSGEQEDGGRDGDEAAGDEAADD